MYEYQVRTSHSSWTADCKKVGPLLRTGIALVRKFNFEPAPMKRILILQNSGQDHFVTDM
jgi:hypothetical protein